MAGGGLPRLAVRPRAAGSPAWQRDGREPSPPPGGEAAGSWLPHLAARQGAAVPVGWWQRQQQHSRLKQALPAGSTLDLTLFLHHLLFVLGRLWGSIASAASV